LDGAWRPHSHRIRDALELTETARALRARARRWGGTRVRL